ncbi:alpha/beta hydrolase family protein [Paenibacillus cymbidii]|uniref:alpha/beta hydrolase family protein n=1 Tax=Paenibacillus cymbidii TaxID=1639034 RepID=UPI0010819D6D|nr:alpha/beta fold hydrolase [Paenibacillus cymbidii]
MANRNFGMSAYWRHMVQEWTPQLSFRGSGKEEWAEWREQASGKFLELLGEFPARVDLAAEVEYAAADGDLIRERVIFDSEAFASVPCVVLRPAAMQADRSHAAIICCHGHPVDRSKDAVAGVRSGPEYDALIARMNYNYGEQLAKAGFLTIMPDLRGFGERNDTANKSDACNHNYVKGTILGINPAMLNVWDIKCCVDYLQTRPEVDPERIGMIGLSFGGTMTAFAAAVEPRIKAADISGYINPFRGFGIARGNFCGSQVVPDLYKYFDTHDIAGLIAPRPLLVEMGMYDDCFYFQDLMKGYEGVKAIYEAAGAADRLEADIFSGGHAFAGGKAFAFFKRYL